MQWVGFYSEYETFPPGHGLGSRHTGDWEEWLDDHSQAPGPGHIHEDRYSDKAVHHALVIGPGTVGEGQRDLTIPDIADGWTNTLAFVEIRGQVPREARYATLHIDDLASLLDESGALPPYDIHDLGRGLMFMDGAMYRQKKPLNRQQLLALMTIAGGENLTRESLEKSGAIELRNAGYLPVLRPNVGFPIRGFTP